MRIHILGICGTFMAGLAVLAKQLGHEVEGCDAQVYPPMSDQLRQQGIQLFEGYKPEHLHDAPDLIIVGNAMSRGNPIVEYMLDRNLNYISGPQWLAENILKDRWVAAIAGTHGKTTTTSLLAWMLEHAGLKPGFLIGGIANNFTESARLGEAPFFVVEADEYDSAFFDKRSKFVHYQPRSCVINNLEFDHADIFDDLAAVKRQFHHLVRTVPSNGLLICPEGDSNIEGVLKQGCWTPVEYFDGEHSLWQLKNPKRDYSEFDVIVDAKNVGRIKTSMIGKHNARNILAALAAARHCGVTVEQSIDAVASFKGLKRRMEVIGCVNGVTVYDDFAHHPTAIATTLDGLRRHVGEARILAVLELGSYTMSHGVHKQTLGKSLSAADVVFVSSSKSSDDWDVQQAIQDIAVPAQVFNDPDALINAVVEKVEQGDHLIIMSNTGFAGTHQKLLAALK